MYQNDFVVDNKCRHIGTFVCSTRVRRISIFPERILCQTHRIANWCPASDQSFPIWDAPNSAWHPNSCHRRWRVDVLLSQPVSRIFRWKTQNLFLKHYPLPSTNNHHHSSSISQHLPFVDGMMVVHRMLIQHALPTPLHDSILLAVSAQTGNRHREPSFNVHRTFSAKTNKSTANSMRSIFDFYFGASTQHNICDGTHLFSVTRSSCDWHTHEIALHGYNDVECVV